MIRETKFLISRKPYAIDLASIRRSEREPDKTWAWYSVNAVWFRGRKTEPVACIGTLRTIIDDPAPADARQFLERYTDGRSCDAGHCDRPSIGWRLFRGQREWLPVCGLHMDGPAGRTRIYDPEQP